jgi:hypothetical protein
MVMMQDGGKNSALKMSYDIFDPQNFDIK